MIVLSFFFVPYPVGAYHAQCSVRETFETEKMSSLPHVLQSLENQSQNKRRRPRSFLSVVHFAETNVVDGGRYAAWGLNLEQRDSWRATRTATDPCGCRP